MSIIKGTEKHRFICTDTGTQKLFEFDINGNITWEMYIGCYAFGVWLFGENILYCHYGSDHTGARVIDRNGKILLDYKTENEVFDCQLLENGNILVGELRKKRIVEINKNAEIVKEIPVFCDNDNLHEVMRSFRKTTDGNYIVAQPALKKIIKYSEKGDILWEAETHPDSFGVVEKPNGNVLYTCKSGLYEIDRNGIEIWSVTDIDIPEIEIKWLLGMQLLPNENIVCCNWLGHGLEKQGVPLFEITPKKELVWICDSREITENMANFQILDV